jgi:hypothetical protein
MLRIFAHRDTCKNPILQLARHQIANLRMLALAGSHAHQELATNAKLTATRSNQPTEDDTVDFLLTDRRNPAAGTRQQVFAVPCSFQPFSVKDGVQRCGKRISAPNR